MAYGARCRPRPAGVAIAGGGLLRDLVFGLAHAGRLGTVLDASASAAGYDVVYAVEIVLLFGTLIAVGPLVRPLVGAAEAVAADWPDHQLDFSPRLPGQFAPVGRELIAPIHASRSV